MGSIEIAPKESAGIFGLENTPEDAEIVLCGVGWGATASYGMGAADTPWKIIRPSHQLDLYDPDFGSFAECGIYLHVPPDTQKNVNAVASKLAAESRLTESLDERRAICDKVNAISHSINDFVYSWAKQALLSGKKVGLLGGDHSCPFGLLKALIEKHGPFGILHIDAHMDLRRQYEGFVHSHASIMYNVMTHLPVSKLVSVGIRDYSLEELEFSKSLGERCSVYTDRRLFSLKAEGTSWSAITQDVLDKLPEKVYVSFDIDGLDPSLCPNTGTPVPGGLQFNEASHLLHSLSRSGRQIVGFDLCEVASLSGDWDLNVGARVLFKLCGLLAKSGLAGAV